MKDAGKESGMRDARAVFLLERRRMLAWIGVSTVAVPLLGLTGCGDDDREMRGSTMNTTADNTVDPSGPSASNRSPDSSRSGYGDAAGSKLDDSGASRNSTTQMDGSDPSDDRSGRSAVADPERGQSSSRMRQGNTGAGHSETDGRPETQVLASDRGGEMPTVDVSSPQAQSLAYVHEAAKVDASAQPRYEQGQRCSNCALYQGGDQPWGGCPLFTGKRVKATGWCNAYVSAS